jgi:hypothetical protein
LGESKPEMTFSQILAMCGAEVPNFAALESTALFSPSDRGDELLSLVDGHNKMEQILAALYGSSFPKMNRSKSFSLEGVVFSPVTADRVLTAFGWKSITFTGKRLKYKKAANIAQRSWKGAKPGA